MPTVNLTQPQSDFYRTYRAPGSVFTLFIGGFGSGKSETLVVNAMDDLFSCPGSNVGVYSPTYDLLKLILLPRFENYLRDMGIKYELNKTDYTLKVAGYGMLIFRSLDRESRIIGYEHYSAHIDEIDTLQMNKAEAVWLKVIGRNRQVPPGQTTTSTVNRIGLYTTPEGFAFTYKYFSEKGEFKRKATPEEREMYKYVRAPTYSNPHTPAGYLQALRATYPEHMIEAYVEGYWVNMSSGRVYPKFDRELNRSPKSVLDSVTKNETIYIGMDFNVERGCSVAHVLRGPWDSESGQFLPEYAAKDDSQVTAHAIFEVYNAFDTPAQMDKIKERFPDNPIEVHPDASGKHRRSSNATDSDFAVVKATPKVSLKQYNYNGSIKDRITAFNARICDGSQVRHYFVNDEQCPNSAAALETQVYDRSGQPEKGPGKWDDINDGPGYFVVRKWPIRRPVANSVAVTGTY
ncbi:terminase large subunit domain-containing protein [Zhongshania sp.]|uniref:terminase large subunit domain-containing protein n=1 Tax=Zhongshania sp. TaxID=1971902 RepID=UPI003567CB84